MDRSGDQHDSPHVQLSDDDDSQWSDEDGCESTSANEFPAGDGKRKRRSDVFGYVPKGGLKGKKKNVLTPTEYKVLFRHVQYRIKRNLAPDTAKMQKRFPHLDGVALRREIRRAKQQVERKKNEIDAVVVPRIVLDQAARESKMTKDKVLRLQGELMNVTNALRLKEVEIHSAVEVAKPLLGSETDSVDDLCGTLGAVVTKLRESKAELDEKNMAIMAESAQVQERKMKLDAEQQHVSEELAKATSELEKVTAAEVEVVRLKGLNEELSGTALTVNRQRTELQQRLDSSIAKLEELSQRAATERKQREVWEAHCQSVLAERDSMAAELEVFETCTAVEEALTQHKYAFSIALDNANLFRRLFPTQNDEQSISRLAELVNICVKVRGCDVFTIRVVSNDLRKWKKERNTVCHNHLAYKDHVGSLKKDAFERLFREIERNVAGFRDQASGREFAKHVAREMNKL